MSKHTHTCTLHTHFFFLSYKLQDSNWLEYLFSNNKIYLITLNAFGSQINTNGILSFNSRNYWQPQRFTLLNIPLIAPFWLRFQNSGNVYFRKTSDAILLQRARDQLHKLFPSSDNFTPTILFIATWERLRRYQQESEVTVCIHTVTTVWTIAIVVCVVTDDCIIIIAGKHIPGCNCSRLADDICVLHI